MDKVVYSMGQVTYQDNSNIVLERVGKSRINIFFHPNIYDVPFSEVVDLCDSLEKMHIWNVKLISDEDRCKEGIITLESHLAKQFFDECLEDAAAKVVSVIKRHRLYGYDVF